MPVCVGVCEGEVGWVGMCGVCVGGEWVWSEWVRGGMCVHCNLHHAHGDKVLCDIPD